MPSTVELERMVIRLIGDSKAYERTIANAEKRTKEFDRQLSGALTRVGGRMKMVGRKMTAFITLPAIAAAGASVAAFAQFNQAMTKSLAIMDMTGATTDQLRDKALELGAQGAKGPAELAEAYFFLASAGLNAGESIEALPIVTRFATAGAFDMAKATDLLTDAQSALGLNIGTTADKMREMKRVSDVLVKANTLANATVEQFSTALTSKAGASLKAYGKTVEEGTAVLAAMADQGIKAELAGNALDRVNRLLAKSSLDNAKAHEQLGFSVFDAEGNMRSYADIIGNLEKITGDMTAEAKAAALAQLGFEARVQGVILPLLGTSEAIEDYNKKLDNASGTTDEVAKKQLKSFTNQLKITWNQLKKVAIGIGGRLAPILQSLNELLRGAIKIWEGLPGSIQVVILSTIALAAAIGPLLIVMGSLVSSVGTLTAAYGSATVAQGAFTAGAKAARIAVIALKVAMRVGLVLALGAVALQAIGAFDAMRKLKNISEETSKTLGKINKFKLERFGELGEKDQTKTLEREKQRLENMKRQLEGIKKQGAEASGLGSVIASGGFGKVGDLMARAKDLEARAMKQKELVKQMEEQIKLEKEAENQKVTKDALAALEEEEKKQAAMLKLEQDRLNKVADFQTELQNRIALFGLEGREAEIRKLQIEGATQAELEHIRALDAKLKKMEEEAKKIREQEAARKRMEKKGEMITRQFRTPEQKLVDRHRELEELLKAGAIDQGTFNRALSAAEEEFKRAQGIGGPEAGRSRRIAGDNQAVFGGTAAFRDSQRQTAALIEARMRPEEETTEQKKQTENLDKIRELLEEPLDVRFENLRGANFTA